MEPSVQDGIIHAVCENKLSVREAQALFRRLKNRLDAAAPPNPPPDSPRSAIREQKNGAFMITARIDPRDPKELHGVIEDLRVALKRATALERKLAREKPDDEPTPPDPSS
jgi:hypothetical protein